MKIGKLSQMKVTDKDVEYARFFLVELGAVKNMPESDRHYITILAKKVIEQLESKIELPTIFDILIKRYGHT